MACYGTFTSLVVSQPLRIPSPDCSLPLRAASPRAAETWEVWDEQDLTETSRKNSLIPLNLPHDDFTSPATSKSDEGNGLV